MTVAQLSDDAAALIHALHLRAPDVWGQSLGAGLRCETLLGAPARDPLVEGPPGGASGRVGREERAEAGRPRRDRTRSSFRQAASARRRTTPPRRRVPPTPRLRRGDCPRPRGASSPPHAPATRLLPQPRGLQGFAVEPQRVEGSATGQVVLDPKEAPVPQPHALVEVTLKLDPTAATLGSQTCARQDAIIASLDQLVQGPLQARPRFPPAGEKLRTLLQTVAGPRIRKLSHRVSNRHRHHRNHQRPLVLPPGPRSRSPSSDARPPRSPATSPAQFPPPLGREANAQPTKFPAEHATRRAFAFHAKRASVLASGRARTSA